MRNWDTILESHGRLDKTVCMVKVVSYHFSQIFRTSFRIIHKNNFCHEFSFLTDSLKPLPPTSLMAEIR